MIKRIMLMLLLVIMTAIATKEYIVRTMEVCSIEESEGKMITIRVMNDYVNYYYE